MLAPVRLVQSSHANNHQPALLLPNSTHLSLVAIFLLLALPFIIYLPAWISITTYLLLIWRGLIASGWLPPITPTIKQLLTLLFGTSVIAFALYGWLSSREAWTSILLLLLTLKLHECQRLRDYHALLLLTYFMIGALFLYSQSIVVAIYSLLLTLLTLAIHMAITHPNGQLPRKSVLKTSLNLMLQAIPLTLLLFLLLPRVSGPLWSFHQDQGSAVTGLSQSMNPWDITRLAETEEIAMRVKFEEDDPPIGSIYWRGPVLWDFDGRTWHRGAPLRRPPQAVRVIDQPLNYEVTLEAHGQPWLYGIDLPFLLSIPNVLQTADFHYRLEESVDHRIRYRATSYLSYQIDSALTHEQRYRALRLPGFGNPKTRALARNWRRQAATHAEIIDLASAFLRSNDFRYTMITPRYEHNPIDQFLFEDKKGFCGHFASSFTFLMRAAGVPARVVTGYQGAEYNAIGDYHIIRQSEAHAWVEVWLPNQGWIRIDPTAIVAPERISFGLIESLPDSDPLTDRLTSASPLWNSLRQVLDTINNDWNQWVLGYDANTQSRLLNWIGIGQLSPLQLSLAIWLLFMGIITLLAIQLLKKQAQPNKHPIAITYALFCDKMSRIGIPKHPYEGPIEYQNRICSTRVDLCREVKKIINSYVKVYYAQIQNRQQRVNYFKNKIERFKPKSSSD